LPKIGYFKTNRKDKYLKLYKKETFGEYIFYDDYELVTYEFKDILNINDTNIEIYQYNISLLEKLFVDKNNHILNVDIKNTVDKHFTHLNNAFKILKIYYPMYYNRILKVTKGVVLFNGHGINSFATMSAHGIAFFNVTDDNYDEVFFIEDILHQCGHIVFSALTFEKQKYFVIDPNLPLSILNNYKEDNRSIYVVFHGIFTETAMNECLDICYDLNIFTGKQKHELLGRFAFILKRFDIDIKNLNNVKIYKKEGLNLFVTFMNVFERIYRKRFPEFAYIDITNQPYNFDYRKYLKLNPFIKQDKRKLDLV